MDWKFKKNAEPQGSSDGFWYDITLGGYINLNAVLEDQKQIDKVNESINILSSLEESMIDNDLLNEF